MAVQSAPVLPQTPNVGVTQLTTTAAANTFVTAYTGGANGSKITAISAVNSSTSTINLLGAINSAATNFVFNAVSLVSNAGINGTTSPGSLMGSFQAIDGDGNPYLFLASSAQTLTVTITSSIPTTGGFVAVTVTAADF